MIGKLIFLVFTSNDSNDSKPDALYKDKKLRKIALKDWLIWIIFFILCFHDLYYTYTK